MQIFVATFCKERLLLDFANKVGKTLEVQAKNACLKCFFKMLEKCYKTPKVDSLNNANGARNEKDFVITDICFARCFFARLCRC